MKTYQLEKGNFAFILLSHSFSQISAVTFQVTMKNNLFALEKSLFEKYKLKLEKKGLIEKLVEI